MKLQRRAKNTAMERGFSTISKVDILRAPSLDPVEK